MGAIVGIPLSQSCEHIPLLPMHSALRKLSLKVKNHLNMENAQEFPFVQLEESKQRRKMNWNFSNILQDRGSRGYEKYLHEIEEITTSDYIQLVPKVIIFPERASWPTSNPIQSQKSSKEFCASSTGLAVPCLYSSNPAKLVINAMLDQRWHRVLELLSHDVPTHSKEEDGSSVSLLDIFLYSIAFTNVSITSAVCDCEHTVIRILDRLLVKGCSVEVGVDGIQKSVLSSMYQSLYNSSQIDFHALFRRLIQGGLQVPDDILITQDLQSNPLYHVLHLFAKWSVENPESTSPPKSIISKIVLLLNLLYSGATLIPGVPFSNNSAVDIIVNRTHANIVSLFKRNPPSLFAQTRLKVRQLFPRRYFREIISSELCTSMPFFQTIQGSTNAIEFKDLVEWLNLVHTFPDNIRHSLMFLEYRVLKNDITFILFNDPNKQI